MNAAAKKNPLFSIKVMENVHVASDNCCSFNFVLKCLPNKGHYDLSSYKFDPHVLVLSFFIGCESWWYVCNITFVSLRKNEELW